MTTKDDPQQLLRDSRTYFEPMLYSHSAPQEYQGRFLNNRAVFTHFSRKITLKNTADLLLNDFFDVYKNYNNHELLPYLSETVLLQDNIVLMLLKSIQSNAQDSLTLHRFERLEEVCEELSNMDVDQLQDCFADSETVIPILNLADYLIQTGEKSLEVFGETYLRIAAVVCERLCYSSQKPRVNSLNGILLLQRGKVNEAISMLTASHETSNFADFTHEINPLVLSSSKTLNELEKGQGRQKWINKAESLKSALKIQDWSIQIASLMLPKTFTQLLDGK